MAVCHLQDRQLQPKRFNLRGKSNLLLSVKKKKMSEVLAFQLLHMSSSSQTVQKYRIHVFFLLSEILCFPNTSCNKVGIIDRENNSDLNRNYVS